MPPRRPHPPPASRVAARHAYRTAQPARLFPRPLHRTPAGTLPNPEKGRSESDPNGEESLRLLSCFFHSFVRGSSVTSFFHPSLAAKNTGRKEGMSSGRESRGERPIVQPMTAFPSAGRLSASLIPPLLTKERGGVRGRYPAPMAIG